jgi:hypothetical protein
VHAHKLFLTRRLKISAIVIASMFFVLLVTVVLRTLFMLQTVSADTSTWQRGANIQPSYSTEFFSTAFRDSLAQLKATNANYVTFVIPLYQPNLTSTTINAGNDTPTDEALAHAIDTAHSLGLKVNLKPHIESQTGEWRAEIDPPDRQAWFTSYGTILKRYAQIAKDHNVEQITIGTELIKLSANDYNTANTGLWEQLIAELRALYSGSLTYAANWGIGWADEKNRITFWNKLDVVGIDAYYPLGIDYYNMSVENMKSHWNTWYVNDILPFAQKVQKPIVFTEIGYRSTTGAHTKPHDSSHTDGVNLVEQANAYEALFQFWNDKSIIAGIHIWDWQPNAETSGMTESYTPQNKPAQTVIARWFGGAVANPSIYSFTSSATVSKNPAEKDRQLSIAGKFTNTGGRIFGAIPSLTILDAQNTVVFEKKFANQTIQSGAIKNYTATWIPTTNGTYTIVTKVSHGDSTVIHENTIATTFSVTDPTVTTNRIGFTTSARMAKTVVLVNQPTTITAVVTNTGDSITNLIVDVEIYSASGAKVGQKVFSNQNFNLYQSQEYPVAFTPPVIGDYTVKIGIFSADWSKNYIWNNKALVFSAQTTVQPPRPLPQDAQPPSVTITTAPDLQALSGLVTISANATDDVGVVGVQFLLDGQSLGLEDSGIPYTIFWDTRNVTNGSHTLGATARDASGKSSTATITVTVENSN